jgi:hypothetical protein
VGTDYASLYRREQRDADGNVIGGRRHREVKILGFASRKPGLSLIANPLASDQSITLDSAA